MLDIADALPGREYGLTAPIKRLTRLRCEREAELITIEHRLDIEYSRLLTRMCKGWKRFDLARAERRARATTCWMGA
jgi:hypothetical protein